MVGRDVATPLGGPNLVIKPGVLKPGATYKLKLLARKRGDFSLFSCGHATLLVPLSVPPSLRPSIREHESKSVKTRISAPANPSATGIGRVSGLVLF